MATSNGWTAVITHVSGGNDWCHFIKGQQGVIISDSGTECETLDPNVSYVYYECDDNLVSSIDRQANIIFQQKGTGVQKLHVVTQAGSPEYRFFVSDGSITYDKCSTIPDYNVTHLNNIKNKLYGIVTYNSTTKEITPRYGIDYVLKDWDKNRISYTAMESYTQEIDFINNGQKLSVSVVFGGNNSTSTSSTTVPNLAYNSNKITTYDYKLNTTTTTIETEVVKYDRNGVIDDTPCGNDCDCWIEASPTGLTCEGGEVTFTAKQTGDCGCVEVKQIETNTVEGESSKQITVKINKDVFTYSETIYTTYTTCGNVTTGSSVVSYTSSDIEKTWVAKNPIGGSFKSNNTTVSTLKGGIDSNSDTVLTFITNEGVTSFTLEVTGKVNRTSQTLTQNYTVYLR